jgi:hypothetical protein
MKSQKEGGFGPPRAVTPWMKKKKKVSESTKAAVLLMSVPYTLEAFLISLSRDQMSTLPLR